MPDEVRAAFGKALIDALDEAGLTVNEVERRTRALSAADSKKVMRIAECNNSTLSRWCNGGSMPMGRHGDERFRALILLLSLNGLDVGQIQGWTLAPQDRARWEADLQAWKEGFFRAPVNQSPADVGGSVGSGPGSLVAVDSGDSTAGRPEAVDLAQPPAERTAAPAERTAAPADRPADPASRAATRRRPLTTLIVVAGVAAAAGITFGVALAGTPGPITRAVSVGGVTVAGAALLVAVIMLGEMLVTELRRVHRVPPVDPETELAHYARELEARWARALESQRLIEPRLRVGWSVRVPTEQTWQQMENVADQAGRACPSRPTTAPTGHDETLADVVLDCLPARRLLLFGGSGSGKSVLLLEVAQALNQRASQGDQFARPVLFSIKGWVPSRPFEEWLIEQLLRDEPRFALPDRASGQRVVDVLLRKGRLFPLLDGLDEIGDVAARREAMAELSDWFRTRTSLPGMIITSHPDPTDLAGYAFATADIAPLTAHQVAAYLRDDRWSDLLEHDRAVAHALDRPLMVGLAAEVYRPSRRTDGSAAAGPTELFGQSVDAIHGRLFELFLPAAYGRNRRWRWTPGRARGWLRTIAGAQGSLYWWGLRELLPPRLIPLALGFLPGVAVGVVAGLGQQLGMGLGSGILVGLAVGWLAQLLLERRSAGAVVDERAASTLPATASDQKSSQVIDLGPGIAWGMGGATLGALLCGSLFALISGDRAEASRGLIGALGAGIAAGAATGPHAGFVGGVAGGITVTLTASSGAGWPAGIIDGAAAWIACAIVIGTHQVSLPASALRLPNRRVVLIVVTLPVAVVCGSLIAAAAWRHYGPLWACTAGLVTGAVGGLAAGLSTEPVEPIGLSAAPEEVLRRDRFRFWAIFVVGGLSFGMGAGVAVNPYVGLAGLLTVGTVAGATRTTWPAFLVARVALAISGRLPLRLMRFLEDGCQQGGVLRRNGAGFEIRHAELRDHLLGPSAVAHPPVAST